MVSGLTAVTKGPPSMLYSCRARPPTGGTELVKLKTAVVFFVFGSGGDVMVVAGVLRSTFQVKVAAAPTLPASSTDRIPTV
jgi:hypothetical protein